MQKIKKLVSGAPGGRKKEIKEIEWTHVVIFTIIFALFQLMH